MITSKGVYIYLGKVASHLCRRLSVTRWLLSLSKKLPKKQLLFMVKYST